MLFPDEEPQQKNFHGFPNFLLLDDKIIIKEKFSKEKLKQKQDKLKELENQVKIDYENTKKGGFNLNAILEKYQEKLKKETELKTAMNELKANFEKEHITKLYPANWDLNF